MILIIIQLNWQYIRGIFNIQYEFYGILKYEQNSAPKIKRNEKYTEGKAEIYQQ